MRTELFLLIYSTDLHADDVNTTLNATSASRDRHVTSSQRDKGAKSGLSACGTERSSALSALKAFLLY